MSFLSESGPKNIRVVAGVFAVIGLALRVWLLLARGENYEIDQSVILYWGREFLQKKSLAVFGPEFTNWELLASYYYGAWDLLGLNPQWGALLLSIVEIALAARVAGLVGGVTVGWATLAVLAVLPWHVFYSSIVGTCVAVGIWPAFLFLRGRGAGVIAIGARVLGLWHYSAFRCFVVFEVLWAVARRQWRALIGPAVAGFAFVALTLLTQPELWRRLLFRGEYVFDVPGFHGMLNYVRAVFFFVSPLWENRIDAARAVSDMEIGSALVAFLGTTGWSLTFLGTGFFVFGLARFWRKRDELARWILGYFIFSVIAVGFAPSLTHYLFLVPVAALFMGVGIEALVRERRWGMGVFVFALTLMVWESARMIQFVSVPQPRDYFSARIAKYAQILHDVAPEAPSYSKMLLSPQGYVEARYWAARTDSFHAIFPSDPDTLERQLNVLPVRVHWILIDTFEDPTMAIEQWPEVHETYRRVAAFRAHVRKYAQILEERPIDDPPARGILLKIRWP